MFLIMSSKVAVSRPCLEHFPREIPPKKKSHGVKSMDLGGHSGS